MSTILGEKLRRLRKEKGYSLDKLAELSGSSKSYMWELENKSNLPIRQLKSWPRSRTA